MNIKKISKKAGVSAILGAAFTIGSVVFAAATIPEACSTPGTCTDISSTFQAITTKTSMKFLGENKTNFIELKAPSSQNNNTSYILPGTDGQNGNVLSTNGSGVLSWIPEENNVNSAIGTAATLANMTKINSFYKLEANDGSSVEGLYWVDANGDPKLVVAGAGTASNDNNDNNGDDDNTKIAKLNAIKQLFDDATDGTNTDVQYVTASDSKRDGWAAGQQILYPEELQKYHIRYNHQSVSAITAEAWTARDASQRGLAKLIADAKGVEGEDTIVEYNLGFNDYNQYSGSGHTDQETYEHIKPLIKAGIQGIIDGLPKAHIFLAEPLDTSKPKLKQIYAELSDELNLPLIHSSIDVKMDNTTSKVKFFDDEIHPNTFGAMRIIHNMMLHITGNNSRSLAVWNNDLYADTSSKQGENLAEGVTIDHRAKIFDNFYSDDDNFRSITIPVIGGTILKINHPGDRDMVAFLGSDDKGVLNSIGQPSDSSSRKSLTPVRDMNNFDTIKYKYVYVPKLATKAVINFTLNADTTDFDNKITTTPADVRYATPTEITNDFPTEADIDSGLPN